jgi:hypothetical protein
VALSAGALCYEVSVVKSLFPVVVPVLALLVAAQALSTGGSWLVCRYTGAVMDTCQCAQRASPAGAASSIEDQGCCVLVRSEPAAIAAILKLTVTTASAIVNQVSLPPAANQELRTASAERALASHHTRRRSTPLYVQVRSLLI